MKKILILALCAAAIPTYALPTYEPFTEYSNACVLTGSNAINLATGAFIAPSGETWTSLNFSGTAGTGLHGLDILVTNNSASVFTATALSSILPSTFPGFPPAGKAITTVLENPAQAGASANLVGNSAVLTFSQDFTRPTNGTKTLYVSYLFDIAQVGQAGPNNVGRYLAFVASTNLVEGSNTTGAFKTFNNMFNSFNNVSNRYVAHGVISPSSGVLDIGPTDSSAGKAPSPFPATFPLSSNVAHFVVGQITFTTGAVKDTNTLWLDPAVNSFGGSAPPSNPIFAYPMTTVMSDLGGMVVIDRPGSGTSGGVGTNYMANLLIGTTWSYVTGGPEFTNQPATVSVLIGGNATLSAAAVAAAQSVSYHWQKIVGASTNNLTDGNGTAGGTATVSGSATPNLTLTGISPADLGSYQVVATASGTGFTLASSVAAVVSDPLYLSQPQPAQSLYGGQVTFTATALTTHPSLTYAWYDGPNPLVDGLQIDGSVVSGSSGTISGGTNTLTLTVSNVSYQNNGSIYSLFVTNNFNNGAFSTPVALTVLDPYIVTQPTNTTVLAGTSASLGVVANGSAPVSYQWVQGSSPLSDGPGPGGSTISGSQSNILTITGVNDANDGSYYVSVIGNASGQTTNSAIVTLVAADPVAFTQSPRSLAERVGDHLAFTVGATGGALNYQWQFNGTNIAGATSTALVLTNIQTTNGGTYSVVVGNIAGTNSAFATLTVINSTVLPLSSTNIVVARVGDGVQPLSGATGNTIYLDQYTPSGVYVNTIQVPDEAVGKPYGTGGSVSLTNSPALLAQGAGADAINSVFLTLSAGNQQYLDLAAYCQQYPFSGADVTAVISATNSWRGLSTIDAFGNYTLAYTNLGLYSGGNHTIRSMVTLDGTNFYTTGQAGSGGVKYVNSTVGSYATGNNVPSSSASATGARVVQVVNGPLTGFSSVNNLVCSDTGGLFASGGTPEPGPSGLITFTNLIPEGGQPNDFAFSPDNQTVYIADGQAFAGTNIQAGGIERWDTNSSGGGWSYSYTLAPLNGLTNGAQSLAVYFPPGITAWGPGVTGAILYTTSYDTRSNSLTQIVDNGPASIPTVIATAGQNQALRGVRFGPTAVPVSILTGPVNQTNFPGNGVTFSVTPRGTPPFTYQWQFNGTNIAGATNSSFTTNNLTFASTGNYSVIVSNLVPSSASATAVLTVTAGAPVFALGVQSYVETVGDHLAFAPSITGSLPIGAQWFLNNTGNPIPGATNLSLVLTNIQTSQSGTYLVQVSNIFGTNLSSGTLVVTASPQTLSSNNLVVARIGDGAQVLSGATGNTLYLDQYTPAGTYVNTIQIPDEGIGQPYGTGGSDSTSMPFGSPALLVCGGNLAPANDAPFQALLSRSGDGQTINFAGYCDAYPFLGPDITTGANGGVNWRGIGGVNAFGLYALAYTNTGLYSLGGHQIHGAVTSDQTNFWTTGEAGSTAVKYLTPSFEPANGGGIPGVGGSAAGTRAIQVVGGNLDYSDVGTNPVGIYQISGLPQNSAVSTILIPETNSPMDFAFSPDGNTAYIADNGAFGGSSVPAGGIERWDLVSGTYTYSYTLATGAGSTVGARGVTVDFSAQPAWGAGVTGAKIFATTAEATGNRLVRIIDNGAGSGATTLLTTSPGNILSGIKFGPQAVPVSIVSQPQNAIALTGSGASFSVVASGSQPYYYQWQFNGTNLAGATQSTLTVNAAQAALPGTYTAVVSNQTPSTATSVPVSITFVPVLTFNGDGQSWSSNGTAGLPLYVYNGFSNVVEMTQGVGNQGSSTFFNTPVYIGGFLATWTYQVINPAPTNADGMAFVIQNDPRGPAAIAAFGGAFGYGSVGAITPSAALEFNLFSGAASGAGVSFNTNGALGPNVNPAPLVLDSGNPINVSVHYLNGLATLAMLDTVTSNAFTTNVSANIPAIVGANQAYVGFTGSDGGAVSTQTISNFVFTSLVSLSALPTNSASLTLTWPTGIGGYVLQQNSTIGAGAWVNVTNPVSVVNGLNQTTVPITGGSQFYRLINP